MATAKLNARLAAALGYTLFTSARLCPCVADSEVPLCTDAFHKAADTAQPRQGYLKQNHAAHTAASGAMKHSTCFSSGNEPLHLARHDQLLSYAQTHTHTPSDDPTTPNATQQLRPLENSLFAWPGAHPLRQVDVVDANFGILPGG